MIHYTGADYTYTRSVNAKVSVQPRLPFYGQCSWLELGMKPHTTLRFVACYRHCYEAVQLPLPSTVLTYCIYQTLAKVLQKSKYTDHFWKYVTPVYDDVGRRSIYQTVQLFMGSKRWFLNVAILKYFLHIPINLSHKNRTIFKVCNSCIWWRRKVILISKCSVLYLKYECYPALCHS